MCSRCKLDIFQLCRCLCTCKKRIERKKKEINPLLFKVNKGVSFSFGKKKTKQRGFSIKSPSASGKPAIEKGLGLSEDKMVIP